MLCQVSSTISVGYHDYNHRQPPINKGLTFIYTSIKVKSLCVRHSGIFYCRVVVWQRPPTPPQAAPK
jgi:hypothetical protein